MAYHSLTNTQRARIERAAEDLRNTFADELAEDDDTVEDTHLRAIEIMTVMLGVLDADRDERVIALRWPERAGGPIPWPRLQAPTGLGRGGPLSRWGNVVAKRAANAAPSWYTPAAVTAQPVGADA